MKSRIVFTLLTILWMFVIFHFSNQKAVDSTNNSQSFVRNTIVNVYKLFDSNASEEKLDEIVEIFDVPVRKIAHFIEYFILGVLVLFMFKSYGINNLYIMVLLCFLYATSDEIHQLFIIDRSGSFIDVILDTLGSSCAIFFFNRN